ncbi:MAG: hypothetical protein FAZ92_03337 [Accumulibacter sp.]|nr:MAG: hypothetical protein FAZ92_03337 [Accumulibacter sp.]
MLAQVFDDRRAQCGEVRGDGRPVERPFEAERAPQPGRASQSCPARAQAWQHQKALAVALQACQQPGAQEARLAGARRTEDDQHALRRAVTQATNAVERLGDLRVAAEEDGGIGFFEHAQAAKERAVWLVPGWPGKGARMKSCALQADAQAFVPLVPLGGRRDVGALVGRGQLDGQVPERASVDQDREDLLAELLCEKELGHAPVRGRPLR